MKFILIGLLIVVIAPLCAWAEGANISRRVAMAIALFCGLIISPVWIWAVLAAAK